jgi:hypothetical protein
MRTFWKLNNWSCFAKPDLHGFGRWILAGAILSMIIIRMRMQVVGETIYFAPELNIYFICLLLCSLVYRSLTSRPQFITELPYTSRQEVKMIIQLIIGSLFIVVLVFVVLPFTLFAFFVFPVYSDYIFNLSIQHIVFSCAYYLFATALLFPLGMIYDKKKWYLSFAGDAVIIALVSLFFINLLPGNHGFRTSGEVFENVKKLPHCNLVLTLMVVVAVGTTMASYHIAQKLHAPKKYE